MTLEQPAVWRSDGTARRQVVQRSRAEGVRLGCHFTEKVHGRARAPSRQTLRVAANEVLSRVPPADGGLLVLFSETAISKRDVITY